MDSLGGKIGVSLSHNVFAYCNNNAVNMVDPDGSWAIAISFATEVIGGILTTAATILSSPVVIVGVAIIATAFLGYAIYTYYTSSSGSASYSSEAADSGSLEEVSSGTGGGGGSISPEPPKKPKVNKKVIEQIHHFLTNKSKKFTPQIATIVSRYGLDLDGDWNKQLMQHMGDIVINIINL